MIDNQTMKIVKDVIYDSYLQGFNDGTIQGCELFYKYIDSIYENKPLDFVLKRQDIKLLIDVYIEMLKEETKKFKSN